MSYFTEVDPGSGFPPFQAAREAFGFVPNLYRAQTLLPRLVELEAGILHTVLLAGGSLTREKKERILLVLAASRQNAYCATLHAQTLLLLEPDGAQIEALISDPRRAGPTPGESDLIDFALRLQQRPESIVFSDGQRLRQAGFTDEAILEAVLTAGLASFLGTLSAGLGVAPDFDPATVLGSWPVAPVPPAREAATPETSRDVPTAPLIERRDRIPGLFAPFAYLEDRCGFVPNVLRAQTARPDVLEAEVRAIGELLLSEGVLPRRLKGSIALAVSGAGLNTACVTMHSQMLRRMGVPEEIATHIALDHRQAGFPEAESALLDFSLKLAQHPSEIEPQDIRALLGYGFTEEQVLEALATTALAGFLDTVQTGLGTAPDFEPAFVPAPRPPAAGPGGGSPGILDPDAEEVLRAREGTVEAFGALIDRHAARLFRLSQYIAGSSADAEDCLQAACLRAYEGLEEFRGTPPFRTWLTRLVVEEGLAGLSARGHPASLDEPGDGEESFRPREVRAWVDDLEAACSREERRRLVEQELARLPLCYRLPLLLRDLDDFPVDEAAAALGLPIAVLKARLSRGRLMLREALAPRFLRPDLGSTRVQPARDQPIE